MGVNIYKWMDGWMDVSIDPQMHRLIDRQIDGSMEIFNITLFVL